MHHSVSDYYRQEAGRTVDYLCNRATINYIIRVFCTPALNLNLNGQMSQACSQNDIEARRTPLHTLLGYLGSCPDVSLH